MTELYLVTVVVESERSLGRDPVSEGLGIGTLRGTWSNSVVSGNVGCTGACNPEVTIRGTLAGTNRVVGGGFTQEATFGSS